MKFSRIVPTNGKARVGLIIIGVYVLVAIFGPWLVHGLGLSESAITNDVLAPPSGSHPLGTTSDGEDVLAQLVVGTRTSLLVGFVAAAIATTLAVLVGVVGGYYGGKTDAVLNAVTNVFLVLPGLPLTIILAGYLRGQGGPMVIALVIALTAWAWGARAKRVQTISLRNRDFVLNARLLGERDLRIMLVEILPSLAPVISSTFMLSITASVLAEAGLDFFGLGNINTVSWGTMLYFAQQRGALFSGAWWWFVPPGLAITLLGAAAGLVNFGIDEHINPRLRVSNRSALSAASRLSGRSAASASSSSDGVVPLSTDVLLTVDNLDVRYASASGAVAAVSDVTFTLRRGEILGVAGESGSGKSTLVTALLRLQRPPAVTTRGTAHLNVSLGGLGGLGGPGGRGGPGGLGGPGGPSGPIDLVTVGRSDLRELRWEHMSIVFQSAMNALNPVHRLDRQFLDAITAHRSVSRAQALSRARDMLTLVGIPADRVTSYPHELSGGQRQRATIALALVCEPDLVVMDEPTTAVDVVMQRQILAQITRLQRKLDFAVVFITHDLSLLLEIADRIAVMYAGRIVEIGPSQDLYQSPRHPYTQGLRDSFPPLRGPSQTLTGIPGTPPNLRALGPGCPFTPRCPLSTEICHTTLPPLRGAEGRLAACHHADQAAEATFVALAPELTRHAH